MRVLIATCNINDFDHVIEPVKQTVSFDYECFTDAPIKGSGRIKGRYIKTNLQSLRPGYDVYIWIDGRIQIASPSFVEDCIVKLEKSDVVTLPHPDRQTLSEELDYIVSQISKGASYLCSRYAINEMIAYRDMVSKLKPIKLYAPGVFAHKGIDFSIMGLPTYDMVDFNMIFDKLTLSTINTSFIKIGKHKMKTTDHIMRAAPFDNYLTGKNLIGVEIGVDVGAHAEAMFHQSDIAKLYLIDIWEREMTYGYCLGRLESKGYKNRINLIPKRSVVAVQQFENDFLDFIYFDQLHDFDSVYGDLVNWWPKLKNGGIVGVRNYTKGEVELIKAVDKFVHENKIETRLESGEIILFK